MRFKDKIVLITGAGRGIGRALSLDFVREGAKIIAASRTENELKDLERVVGGENILTVSTDLTSEDQIKHMVDEGIRRFGSIDILINNAGLGYFNNVVDLSVDEWDTMTNVNLRGVFLCCKYTLPHMIKKNQGMIINIASLAGKNFFATGAGYCATKWGLLGFSKSLMLEVRDYNIKVMTICPGSVDTKFHKAAAHPDTEKKPMLKPEDVSQIVLDAAALPDRAMVSELEIRITRNQ